MGRGRHYKWFLVATVQDWEGGASRFSFSMATGESDLDKYLVQSNLESIS